MKEINERQKQFCRLYLKYGDAQKAYIEAGYSPKGNVACAAASRLLDIDYVKEYMAKVTSELESKQVAEVNEVMKYLTSVMRGEIQEETVVVEGSGDGYSEAKVVEKQVTPKDRNKAAELLGKRYGIWTDKIVHEGDVGVQIVDDIR